MSTAQPPQREQEDQLDPNTTDQSAEEVKHRESSARVKPSGVKKGWDKKARRRHTVSTAKYAHSQAKDDKVPSHSSSTPANTPKTPAQQLVEEVFEDVTADELLAETQTKIETAENLEMPESTEDAAKLEAEESEVIELEPQEAKAAKATEEPEILKATEEDKPAELELVESFTTEHEHWPRKRNGRKHEFMAANYPDIEPVELEVEAVEAEVEAVEAEADSLLQALDEASLESKEPTKPAEPASQEKSVKPAEAADQERPAKPAPRYRYIKSPTLEQAFRNLVHLNPSAAWRATRIPLVIFFVLFSILALAVADQAPAIEALNTALNTAIQSMRGTLDVFFITLTTFGDPLPMVAICLVVCLILALAKKWDSLAFFITNTVLAAVFVQALKLIFAVPRPGDPTLVPLPGSFSFPSAHSFCSLIVFGMIGLLIFRALSRKGVTRNVALAPGIVLLIFAFIIGISRIYVGVHWPSDVLGGWLLAGIWLPFAGALYTVGSRKPAK